MKISTFIIIISIIMMTLGIGGYYYQTGQMDMFLTRNLPEIKHFTSSPPPIGVKNVKTMGSHN